MMSAFSELDWRRFDVWAIVSGRGVASVPIQDDEACVAWLRSNDYDVARVDCRLGFSGVVDQLNRLFDWEGQFGYLMSADRCGLDALRDGFGFGFSAQQALLLVGLDELCTSHCEWLLGFFAIASEYSLAELAVGRRFFLIAVLPSDAPVIGKIYQAMQVPHPISLHAVA